MTNYCNIVLLIPHPPDHTHSMQEEVRLQLPQVTLRHSRVSESHDHRSTHPLSPSHVSSTTYHHKLKETSPRPSSASGSTRRADHASSSEVQRRSYYETSRMKDEWRDHPDSRERAIDVGSPQRHNSLVSHYCSSTTDNNATNLLKKPVPKHR